MTLCSRKFRLVVWSFCSFDKGLQDKSCSTSLRISDFHKDRSPILLEKADILLIEPLDTHVRMRTNCLKGIDRTFISVVFMIKGVANFVMQKHMTMTISFYNVSLMDQARLTCYIHVLTIIPGSAFLNPFLSRSRPFVVGTHMMF